MIRVFKKGQKLERVALGGALQPKTIPGLEEERASFWGAWLTVGVAPFLLSCEAASTNASRVCDAICERGDGGVHSAAGKVGMRRAREAGVSWGETEAGLWFGGRGSRKHEMTGPTPPPNFLAQ
jgi:hypothetical protein